MPAIKATAILVASVLAGAGAGCGANADAEAGGPLGAATDGGQEGSSATTLDTRSPCDPLAVPDVPIALETILGVGADAEGTLYVVDQATAAGKSGGESGEARVFRSKGSDLARVKVDGSGSRGGGAAATTEYTFSFEDGERTQALLVELTGKTTTAMALGPEGRTFLDQPDPSRTPLTVEAPSVLAGLTVKNLPGGAYVRDLADADDGNVLVITVPTVDPTYEHYRFFYGPPSKVDERRASDVGSTHSGALSATLLLDDGPATVRLSIAYDATDAGPLGQAGPGQVTTAGATHVSLVERVPAPATVPGLSFTCFDR